VYCAIGEASKSKIVGVLQPPALATLTVRIETEVQVVAFEARRKGGHCNYPCVEPTLRDSMDHHLVPASETRLRIVRHLTAAAADTHAWTHLE